MLETEKVVTSLLKKKKKDKQNKKPKQVKALATPVCKKSKKKNKRTGKGVSIIWFLVHATYPNYDLFMRVSNQFI